MILDSLKGNHFGYYEKKTMNVSSWEKNEFGYLEKKPWLRVCKEMLNWDILKRKI